MTKFFVSLQTPSVEHAVKALDGSGNSSSMLVGFKRYGSEESSRLIESSKDMNVASEEFKAFVRQHILYYKNVETQIPTENGGFTRYVIKDTRKIPADCPLLEEDPDLDIFEVLTDMFMDSAPWRTALTRALYTVLGNMDLKSLEADLKN